MILTWNTVTVFDYIIKLKSSSWTLNIVHLQNNNGNNFKILLTGLYERFQKATAQQKNYSLGTNASIWTKHRSKPKSHHNVPAIGISFKLHFDDY